MKDSPIVQQTEEAKTATTFRGQTWDAAEYAAKGRFVANLAGGVFDLLAAKPGEAILDLGCGDGALTERIAATGAVVTGVDASIAMVEAARARGLTVHQASGSELQYDGEFDAVDVYKRQHPHLPLVVDRAARV